MAALNDILSAAQALSKEDLRSLSDRILSLLNIPNNENTQEAKCDCCRRCSSDQIVTYGKDKNVKQRYKCKSCNTVFYADSFFLKKFPVHFTGWAAKSLMLSSIRFTTTILLPMKGR